MMRALTHLIAVIALALSPAVAGNADRYDIVGFAQNGRVFIFEVFGTFDAAGGGHSTYFFVDTESDAWLPGTPISVQIGPEGAEAETIELDEIRKRAGIAASAVIDTLGPIEPGFSLARQSLGQSGTDGQPLQWREPYLGGLPTLRPETHSLALTTYPLAVAGCRDATLDVTNKALGFLLRLDSRDVHRDDRIPRSRGCPLEYFLEEVRRDIFSNKSIAIVAVFTPGFEGWDRSFIAVPLPEAN